MKNIFVSILRKSIKNKTYTIINIVGLSIALALSSLLFLYAYNEYNVDSFHEKKLRIHRIVNSKDGCAFTGPMLAQELKEKFPEIEAVTRVRHNNNGYFKYKNEICNIRFDMCFDSSALNIFNFNLIAGNKTDALKNQFSIILTESAARNIFGKANPIGQTLQYNKVFNFTVTGVMQDLPASSTFSIDAIIPFHALEYLWEGDPKNPSNILKERNNESFHTYILFKPNIDVRNIEKKITNFIDINSFGSDFKLQSLPNIYFEKNDRDRWVKKGDLSMVNLLLFIAIGLLAISIINYINLNTAITVNNLFSVGIKKLLGAKLWQLLIFSVIETFMFLATSIIFSAFILLFIKTPFLNILSVDYEFESLITLHSITILIAIILLVTILPGALLVHYFKRYTPIAIINKKHTIINSDNPLNKTLIIIQFSITIIFIVSTLFIVKQVQFIKHKNLGFQKEQLIYVDIKSLNLKQSAAEILKKDLLSIPSIKCVSFSAGYFGDVRRGMSSTVNELTKHYRRIHTDPDYIQTMGFRILEGRDFMWNMHTDLTNEPYLINQAMANTFELNNPLNEKIDGHEIVGVIENFHFEPVHKNIQPLVVVCNPGLANWIINIKLSSNNINNSISQIENIFKQNAPDNPFSFSFADDRINSFYQKEKQFSQLSIIFSIINICISCVGLIGLVLLTINRRIKEIGIRKAAGGAKTYEILSMLNKDLLKLVAISFVIASPIAWYAMKIWLENFAYKTELSWWIFALAGIITTLIALITVSWQSWRAATRNPVESLRYE